MTATFDRVMGMKPTVAIRMFRARLKASGTDLDSLSPAVGVAAMLAFYSEQRAEGCDPEADGDMLLCQWGTYDWGNGEHFSFNLTRQFMTGEGGDEDIRQLSLTLRFEPAAPFRFVGEGNRWCPRPDEVSVFERFVTNSAAFMAVKEVRPTAVALEFRRA